MLFLLIGLTFKNSNFDSASKIYTFNNMVDIIEYQDLYAGDFKKINLEWLDKYKLTEEPDLLMLNKPKETILEPGGAIFLAKTGEEIIGSAALISAHHGIYELAKMTVVPSWQGRGISKLLLEKCLERAAALKAKKNCIVFPS